MMSKLRFLMAGGAGLLLGGCAGVRTGNAPADTVIYTALGAAEAKSTAQKEEQRTFESELTKSNANRK